MIPQTLLKVGLIATALVLSGPAAATWKLVKGYGESTHSQAYADSIARTEAMTNCEDIGNPTADRATVVKRDAEAIVGYGGVIIVYKAKAVMGCSY